MANAGVPSSRNKILAISTQMKYVKCTNVVLHLSRRYRHSADFIANRLCVITREIVWQNVLRDAYFFVYIIKNYIIEKKKTQTAHILY